MKSDKPKTNGQDAPQPNGKGDAGELAKQIENLITRYAKQHDCDLMTLYAAESLVHSMLQVRMNEHLILRLPAVIQVVHVLPEIMAALLKKNDS